MARNRLFVAPSDDGWKVKREGAERASAVTRTQTEAIKEATRLARGDKPAQVVIKRPNGEIREERTYGQDPERYPG
jgi:hypothetical protein